MRSAFEGGADHVAEQICFAKAAAFSGGARGLKIIFHLAAYLRDRQSRILEDHVFSHDLVGKRGRREHSDRHDGRKES